MPDDLEPQPLGPRSEIIRRIVAIVPRADFSDPSWGTYDAPTFSVEFNLGDEETVTSFALHIRGDDLSAGLVADLLTQCGWRAFDPSADSGIFDPATAVDSLLKWRALRDR
jgi:hypothetical protein